MKGVRWQRCVVRRWSCSVDGWLLLLSPADWLKKYRFEIHECNKYIHARTRIHNVHSYEFLYNRGKASGIIGSLSAENTIPLFFSSWLCSVCRYDYCMPRIHYLFISNALNSLIMHVIGEIHFPIELLPLATSVRRRQKQPPREGATLTGSSKPLSSMCWICGCSDVYTASINTEYRKPNMRGVFRGGRRFRFTSTINASLL